MTFKCKMCAANINAAEGATHATCEYCGVTSTLPKVNDEKIANLFNRADHFRRLGEYDKAQTAFENILNDDTHNAEAHWRVVLCRYGIEYVEDPVTKRRVPTCHRTQYASILADPDYLAALEHAPDSITKALYEEEAKTINDIQKNILAIANNEDPFDIFICYKETGSDNQRTPDSALAQDIYYQLTNEGYKTFFARITLEDRLGRDYEPYIFNALNSAKVMLVIGTKKEHFEAVWVKNEWSRYLTLQKNDRTRLLIPCYRDIDPYDMPEELSHLQSQDMSKIGFIQDLVRGVKKVLGNSPAAATTGATAPVAVAAPGVESLMKRGWLFLEDGDWKQADEYFDRVLDIDPEHAPAYVGKLCEELKLGNESQLANHTTLLDEMANYKKALRFADESYRAVLEGYNAAVEERAAAAKERAAAAAERQKAEKEKKRIETIATAERQKAEEEKKRIETMLKSIRQISESHAKKQRAYETAMAEFETAMVEFEVSKKKAEAEAKSEYDKKVAQREAEIRAQQARHESDMQNYKAEVQRLQTQSDNWRSQRLCPYCGGKKGLFGGCKSCKQSVLTIPTPPKKPQPPGAIKFETPAISPPTPPDAGCILANLKVTLGGYAWRVLDIQNDKALLLCDKVIEKKPYHEERVEITWEKCDLRKYLNQDFINSMDETEKSIVAQTCINNKNNQWYDTAGGNATQDHVFLLSIEEVVKYFGDSGQLKNRPKSDSYYIDDAYNNVRIAKDASGGACWWWVRSPGDDGVSAALVFPGGYVNLRGNYVLNDGGGVRPALWLNLTSQ